MTRVHPEMFFLNTSWRFGGQERVKRADVFGRFFFFFVCAVLEAFTPRALVARHFCCSGSSQRQKDLLEPEKLFQAQS